MEKRARGSIVASYKNTNPETVVTAIKDSGAIISLIAKRLGCKSTTAKRLINRWAQTREAFDEEADFVLDIAESKIHRAITEGDLSICKWYLTTKGKHRGYDDSRRFILNKGEPLNITFTGMTPAQLKESGNVEIAEYPDIDDDGGGDGE